MWEDFEVLEILASFIDLISSVPPELRFAVAGLAIMLETSVFAGLVMPGDTVVLVAATTVVDWFEFFNLIGFVLVGSLLGESLGFAIGRFFGPKLRSSRLGVKIGEKNWASADRLVEKRGGIAVFISRFLPVLHSLVPAVAGMTAMRYRSFISWTFAACLIWASLYVGVGFAARASYEQLAGDLRLASFVGVGILVLFLSLIALSRRALGRMQSGE